jgi:DNA repair exonuclease SbcCD ATPase subunit
MTGEESKRIDGLAEKVESLDDKLASVQADVAAIKAVTDALGERRDAEAGALWSKHNAIGDRVGTIEREYVRQKDFAEFRTEMMAANAKRDDRLTEVQGRLAYYVGMGVALCGLINFIGVGGIAAIVFWGGKH